jgi:Tol biopolymer transport system component
MISNLALTAGTRLGVYEITATLGEGGLGEVYRATDSNLKRSVAIKVLPASVAGDADRLARFQREAEVLAALNHPNIAAIYGLERSSDMTALVMELVEGEDLSQRITRGAIPIDEALPIAKQIADALEAAHEQGIIHRDLKPANIKVRSDGTVKVLDFGLAKAMEPAAGSSPSISMSPTLSMHATQAGIILGTAAYMAPEQARGKTVDKRADIWAFGVVLFEMLAGSPPFPGEDISHVLARVIDRDPDWTALPPTLSPALGTYLRRCLVKDPRQRIRDIGDVRLALAGAFEATAAYATTPLAVDAPASVVARALPWAIAGVAVIAAVALLTLGTPWRKAASAAPMRLSAELGGDASLVIGQGSSAGAGAILSPDGAMLAFVGQKGSGKPQIFIRRLDQLQATPLSGTDDAGSAFFSPDGQWVGFFADSKLKKVSVTGGGAVALADAPNPRGGSWAEDGTIVFVPNTRGGVLRVPASGGTPEPLTTLENGEVTQRFPEMLPGGKAVLFTSHTNPTGWDDATIVVQAVPAGRRTIVQRGGYYARYVPTGHILYLHERTLFAVPFDRDRLEVAGQAVPVLEGVSPNAANGGAQFGASKSGALLYVPGQGITQHGPIQWMTRDGKATPLRATPANWFDLAFAPNGQLLALSILDGKQSDVFVYDWARDTLSRLTFDATDDFGPAWTPDGRRIAFSSRRGDKTAISNLWWQRADGTGDAQRLTDSKNAQHTPSWHPSSKFLAFTEINPQTRADILILPLAGDEASGWTPGKPTVFLNSPFDEFQPAFSPDGRWLAYASNETGRLEVYVRPFPGPGGKWQVSSEGGLYPTWSRTRKELFFATLAPDNRVMVASFVGDGDSFQAAKPRLWSESRFVFRTGPIGPGRSFDLHPDSDRIALAKAPDAEAAAKQDKVVFILNFFDELRRLAPLKK